MALSDEQVIEKTSQAPLKDAAFQLLNHLYNTQLFRPPVRIGDDPLFDALKMAHPEASNEDLKRVIQAAVKLDRDCTIYFSYKCASYFDDVTRAVNKAKEENPGFLEETYKLARHSLLVAMR